VIGLTKDEVPVALKKKVTLLIYFSQYMDEHLIYGADVNPSKWQATAFNCSSSASGVFMKKWFRTDRAIVMHLSNGTLQVCLLLMLSLSRDVSICSVHFLAITLNEAFVLLHLHLH